MEDKISHLVGNAHIDAVWLWRFQDGFSEIKATFRSALDRINEFDEFIFTCSCASYYKWIEENCVPMFEEIKEAVKRGKWIIVGGMWIQPDCNMLSSESFARQMLYSQRYFKEKFGITAKTGYNVDSFGHSSGLPRLLQKGGMENYVFMRPSAGAEKRYPFDDSLFKWCCDGYEVLSYRLVGYGRDYSKTQDIEDHIHVGRNFNYPQMLFFGVGNHGGGPTITNIKTIRTYQAEKCEKVIISNPDHYFNVIRNAHLGEIPTYAGELQNHASGCYSANAMIKKLNRSCENRLGEAERMEVLASFTVGHPINTEKNAEAWQKALFNQFHDIICGCSVISAYPDAQAFGYAAIAHGLETTNAAVQKISWAIDTDRNITSLSKECRGALWEQNDMGTPIVVFNPLSHSVKIPVSVHLHTSSGVTDENDIPLPYQMIRANYTNHAVDTRLTGFIAEVPAYGWRTYWVYRNRALDCPKNTLMKAGFRYLENDRVKAEFDAFTGELSSLKCDGCELLGEMGCRTLVLDDSPYDTWAHGQFVFENKIGEFGSPEFDIIDNGDIKVSLRIRQTWRTSLLERTYTLITGDDNLYVDVRLVLNEERVMIKFAFDTGLPMGEFIREVPGNVIITKPSDLSIDIAGREQPMLRFMAIREGDRGLAVVNDGKYSTSCRDGEIRMVAARSCYYGDHYGQRDGMLRAQDIGEQEFKYVVRRCGENLAVVERVAEELNTDFPVITETYHKGNLPRSATFAELTANNVTMSAIKQAEDGRGYIVRLTETAGKKSTFCAKVLDAEFKDEIAPFDISTYRIVEGKIEKCNFLE